MQLNPARHHILALLCLPCRDIAADGSVRYSTLEIEVDRPGATATLIIAGPEATPPADMEAFLAEGADAYMLRLARELDDAILHLRLNEREAGLLVFRSEVILLQYWRMRRCCMKTPIIGWLMRCCFTGSGFEAR